MKNFFFLIFTLFLFLISACNNDPCEDIICLNDGVCVNGACDCLSGFTGPACGDQMTPDKIRITNIRVLNFPATDNNGAGWDLISGADIFVRMSYNNNEIFESDIYYENATPGTNYPFTPSGNLNLNNPTDRYTISLYDYDELDPNDFMGGVEFTPYFNGNQFPSTISIDAGLGTSFEIDVLYTF